MAKTNAGTAAVIQWIHGGGTVQLNPNFTQFEFTQAAETADTTSGAATWDTHNPSRRNWELSFDCFYDDAATTSSGGTADLAQLTAGETGLIAFGRFGTATGKPKLGGSVTVTQGVEADPFDTPTTIKLSFKGNGAPFWNQGSAW
jgi:hypothetical protein